ncbi:MAG: aminotransferase class III-fold pyridoxal phosphate-dependent enzyme, partial [Chloroflexota bacterium]|nr:aminotransferase class III-fold pyridoxal phosphate-dependent enzyme [Chloroflexota bacterium]
MTQVQEPALDMRADDSSVWLARRSGVPPVWGRYTDLVVERGVGSWVETIEGDRYLDYTCGIGVTNTGHSHPRVVAAIAEQAGRIIHAQQNILYHKPGLELHERLPRTFPGLRDGEAAGLFLSNSGAEAIEAAVKLAKYATRRPAIIAFRGSFH